MLFQAVDMLFIFSDFKGNLVDYGRSFFYAFKVFFNIGCHLNKFIQNLVIGFYFSFYIFNRSGIIFQWTDHGFEFTNLAFKSFYGSICNTLFCLQIRFSKIQLLLTFVKICTKILQSFVCITTNFIHGIILFVYYTEKISKAGTTSQRNENGYNSHFYSPPKMLC